MKIKIVTVAALVIFSVPCFSDSSYADKAKERRYIEYSRKIKATERQLAEEHEFNDRQAAEECGAGYTVTTCALKKIGPIRSNYHPQDSYYKNLPSLAEQFRPSAGAHKQENQAPKGGDWHGGHDMSVSPELKALQEMWKVRDEQGKRREKEAYERLHKDPAYNRIGNDGKDDRSDSSQYLPPVEK